MNTGDSVRLATARTLKIMLDITDICFRPEWWIDARATTKTLSTLSSSVQSRRASCEPEPPYQHSLPSRTEPELESPLQTDGLATHVPPGIGSNHSGWEHFTAGGLLWPATTLVSPIAPGQACLP